MAILTKSAASLQPTARANTPRNAIPAMVRLCVLKDFARLFVKQPTIAMLV
jgi:hypothetical protein